MEICKITLSDMPDIMEIERACFTDEAWSEKAFTDYLESPLHKCICVKENGKALAFAIFFDGIEAELLNIATSPDMRGRGFARALLSHFFDSFEKDTFLEVRKGNAPAISLYKVFGFSEIGIRKNYYFYPTEDAVVMKREGQI